MKLKKSDNEKQMFDRCLSLKALNFLNFVLEICGVAAIANKTEWFFFSHFSPFFLYGQYINSLGTLSGMSKNKILSNKILFTCKRRKNLMTN
jgi:hypothetical protein